MKANRLVIPLLAMLLMGLLAGCGGSDPTATPIANNTEPTATASTGGEATATVEPTYVPAIMNPNAKVTVRWWHISTARDQRDYFQNLANEFMKANPDVNVEITVLENEAFKTKLATAMQSGDPPDMFQSWGGGVLQQYASAGLVKDITADIAKDGFVDTIQPGPLSIYKVGDKNYGVPWVAGMVGFWYNKELFTKAGISAPPTTWTEFLDDVKKLKAAGITPIAVGEGDKWPGHFYWVYQAIRIGGKDAFEKAYNRTGKFTDETFVQAGKNLKELIDLEPFQTGFLGSNYPDHQALMANGQAAMELMGQWAPGANRGSATDVDAYNKNLGFFPFPSVEGGAGDPSDALGGADGFAVGKNAPAETIDFMRYFLSLENESAMTKAGISVLPTVKGAEAALVDPIMMEVQKRVESAKYYQLYYDQYLPPAVGGVVNDSTQGLFAGTLTPEQVAEAIEASAASELKK